MSVTWHTLGGNESNKEIRIKNTRKMKGRRKERKTHMKRTEPFRKHTPKIIVTPCLSFVDPQNSDNV